MLRKARNKKISPNYRSFEFSRGSVFTYNAADLFFSQASIVYQVYVLFIGQITTTHLMWLKMNYLFSKGDHSESLFSG